MDSKYNVYLDGILLMSYPDGINELELAIERLGGYAAEEHILRDNAESTLDFEGDGFAYICRKRQENLCEEILCTIERVCNDQKFTLFEGLIKQSKVEMEIKKYIAKCTNLKDNSFSGLFRDVINVEVETFNTKTKGCLPLSLPVIKINTPVTPSTYTIADATAFDSLDLLKYIIAYFTDNRITVKSEYLETNKIAFSTIYNLHNNSGLLNKVYPKVSYEMVFNELRKKETLYQVIRYEDDGTPYIWITPESQSFSEAEEDMLLEIPVLPQDATERVNESQLYNTIEVGSSEVNLDDVENTVVDQQRLVAWNKENYVGCGGCSGEKDTKLNLISDFIIDGNIIHEAMLQAEGADYTHDDKIVMLHYFEEGGVYKLVGNNTSIYNARFQNNQVLSRWVGLSNSCIVTGRFAKYGFKAINAAVPYIEFSGSSLVSPNFDFIRIIGSWGGGLKSRLGCQTEIYDNQNSLSLITDLDQSLGFYDTRNMSVFECQEDGNYVFRAKSKLKCIQDEDADTLFPLKINYEIKFVVYADNTFASLITSGPVTEIFNNNPDTQIDSFDIESPTFALTAENVVVVQIEVTSIDIVGAPFYYLTAIYDSLFELLSDNTTCENIQDTTDLFKPFITECEWPLSINDYLKAKNNKSGYYLVQGEKAWIDKIIFREDKKSLLSLMHKRSFCECIPTS